MKCHSRTFESNVLRLWTKDEMQGAEGEGAGSVLTYVTEPESRKQRSRSPSCNRLYIQEGGGDQSHLHLLLIPTERIKSLRSPQAPQDHPLVVHIFGKHYEQGKVLGNTQHRPHLP